MIVVGESSKDKKKSNYVKRSSIFLHLPRKAETWDG